MVYRAFRIEIEFLVGGSCGGWWWVVVVMMGGGGGFWWWLQLTAEIRTKGINRGRDKQTGGDERENVLLTHGWTHRGSYRGGAHLKHVPKHNDQTVYPVKVHTGTGMASVPCSVHGHILLLVRWQDKIFPSDQYFQHLSLES